jgi:hypothetical protein
LEENIHHQTTAGTAAGAVALSLDRVCEGQMRETALSGGER